MVKFRKKTHRKLNKKSNRSIKGGTRKYHCFKGPRREGFPENDWEASSLSSESFSGKTRPSTPPNRREVGVVRQNSKEDGQDWNRPRPSYKPLGNYEIPSWIPARGALAGPTPAPPRGTPRGQTKPSPRGTATPRRQTKPSPRGTPRGKTKPSPRGTATPRRPTEASSTEAKASPNTRPLKKQTTLPSAVVGSPVSNVRSRQKRPQGTPTPKRQQGNPKKIRGNSRGGTKRKRKNKKKKKRNL